jgi:PhoH-like ATPase
LTKKRKTFILDTSVLLYDKNSIHSFPNNDVVIPIVVLDELDRFKDRNGILGENARYVNRFLDDLRSEGSLHRGVEIKNGQSIRVELNHSKNVPFGLSNDSGDNKIISVTKGLSQDDKDVIVVTKDINFRVKCDALGIKSEDYYKDKIITSENQIFRGFKEIHTDDPLLVDDFYEKDRILLERLNTDLNPNEFVIIKNKQSSLLGVAKGKYVKSISNDISDLIRVSPRNKEQKFALDLLTRDDIPLVTMTGIAGSGKTFLTLMAALSGLNQGKYERIVITRSLQPVGRDIGYLPGDLNEKMNPWIAPIIDNVRHAFKDVTYFNVMKDKGQIEIAPMSFIRGRTFSDTFLIVDEAQNSTIHELKTVITRVGENSKIVLLGDIDQIDTPYIDSLSNGLTIVIEKFKKEKISGHITLQKGERSLLASLASKII